MNSNLPVGRFAAHLESLSQQRAWLGIGVGTASVALVDMNFPAVGFAPLYMPIICGACWKLRPRDGYYVAIVTAILAGVPALHSAIYSADLIALRVVVRIAAFAFIAASIISFRRSYDREVFHAHRDRMTGTLNKEVFHRRCATAIEEAGRARQPLLLVILDLDDFKAVNSREGHLAGDDVLRTCATGASSIIRREDLIGRIGGDEFALLVRVPSIAEGQGFARDLHVRLSAVLAGSRYPVTCSMGALLISPHASRNASELMHAADQAMYRAKATGKNAVEIGRAEEPGLAPIARRATQRREGVA